MKIKKYFLIVITTLTGLLCRVSYGESPLVSSQVNILQSDASGVTVEYRPVYKILTKRTHGTTQYDTYMVEDCMPLRELWAGLPRIMEFQTLLKFSGSRGNSVELLRADYEDLPNIFLEPMPGAMDFESNLAESYFPDQAAYSQHVFMPSSIATLTDIGETRGIFVGTLHIVPAQYNPGAKTLRKYSRIVVRVNYGPREQPHAKTDAMAQGLILNENTSERQTLPSGGSTNPRLISNSVLSSGVWYRFPVAEEGIYKLTGSMLLAAGVPSSADPHAIKIYGNGGFELPLSPLSPSVDDLIENAIYVVDAGSPNVLDAQDYIVFFGKSTRGWVYNSVTKSFSHYLNHFTETNYYWLTYGGSTSKQMIARPSETQSPTFIPNAVIGRVFREDEKINLLSSGQEWLGQVLNPGQQMTYVHSRLGIDVTKPIKYKFNLGSRSSSSSLFTVDEHGGRIGAVSLRGVSIGSYFDSQCVRTPLPAIVTPTFSDDQIQLRFTYNSSSAGGTGYIDWYEIQYSRTLNTLQTDVLNFPTVDSAGIVEYGVAGFSGGEVLAFDVTKFDSAVVITNSRVSSDSCSFRLQQTTGDIREMYVVGRNGFKTPGGLVPVTNQNLHGDTTQAAYIIISPKDFLSAAQRLKTQRERPGNKFLKTQIIDLEMIYNEYGGGLPSPKAIRNYLRYAYQNWTTPPKFVLLFGDGDYDYKRIEGSGENRIPAWETVESFFPLGSYATDDDFAIFDNGNRVSLGVGRLTVRSLDEANAMIDKILEYENAPARDPWKIRATFVADDALAGANENNGTLHTDQAEYIAALLPSLFEERKIYLFEYPTVYTSDGRRKPDVNTAIVNQINQGTLVLNYTGHGNPSLWAHEHVFVRESDFSRLQNKGKYFFLVAATCNYSAFDALNEQSSGEVLAAMPNAGAIGGLSATRAVFSGDNFQLNSTVYRNLFQLDTSGRVRPQRLGDVVYRTKLVHNSGIYNNDRKFFLLGDPGMSVDFPEGYTSIDSIKHLPASQIVQLEALSNPNIVATVRNVDLTKDSNFTGNASIVVYDADRQVQLNDPDAGLVSFKTSGSVIFRGDLSVAGGNIATAFVVPKDISYSNDFGRMTLYAYNQNTDASGFNGNIKIGGTDTTAGVDTIGPNMSLYLDSRSFRPGDVVSEQPLLIADFHDDHGVNTSGAGIGHRIEAWLDQQPQSVDLTPYYQSNLNSYQQGTIQYRLTNVSHGTHTLRLRAWDTYNNSSMLETVFDVVSGVGLTLANVYNYPNPFSSTTVFMGEHNQVSPVDVSVKIYTVAGRLIRVLEAASLADKEIQVPWDGRDNEGDILANGVYLYKMVVKAQEGRFSSEVYGKLSVLR